MKVNIGWRYGVFAVATAVSLFCGVLCPERVSAAVLPTPDPGVTGNSLQYGNFYVYSLNYLSNLWAIQSGLPINQSPYNVDSTPGKIKDEVVIATGASGTPIYQNFAGMDDAFSTPSGNGSANYFATGSAPEPNPTGSWDNAVAPNTWDASISSLRTYLNGSDFVFYFNLNENNSGADALAGLTEGQDMLAWARVSLIDVDGNQSPLYYYVSQVVSSPPAAPGTLPPNTSVFDAGPQEVINGAGWSNTDPRWAYVHGAITVWDKPGDPLDGTFKHYGAAFGGEADAKTINQNLGADQAAFALYNPDLSDYITGATASGYDRVSFDIKFSGIVNGYEQVFVLPTRFQPGVVPEPTSVAVWSLLGLVALVPLWRKRHSAV